MSKPTETQIEPFDPYVESPSENLVLSVPQNNRPAPLSNEEGEYSWMDNVIVGNDQGYTSSCAFQAIANWAEIMQPGKRILDDERIKVYREACEREGRNGGGFTFQMAFYYSKLAGWLPDNAEGIIPTRKMSTLAEQPILAGYSVHRQWNTVKNDGIISSYSGRLIAYHGVCLVAYGFQGEEDPTPWHYHVGSWGIKWAYKGMARLTGNVHRDTVMEMWKVVFS